MGVRWLGICLNPSSDHFVSPETLAQIQQWVVGPLWVGEVSAGITPEQQAAYTLDALQTDDPAALPALHATGLPLWLRITSPNPDDWKKVMERSSPRPDYFLLEPLLPHALTQAHLQSLDELSAVYPLVLGFGWTAQNALSLQEGGLAGLAVSGDLDACAELLEAILD